MKRSLLLICMLVFFIATQTIAQKTISEEVLKDVKKSFILDAQTKASMNALTKNNIKDLTLNRENIGKTDHYFKYKVNVSGITDQHSSGRCWMFTSLNMFRPKVIDKLNVSKFEFSENYLYFWHIFEQANLFLENIIETADKPMDDRYVRHYFGSPVSDGAAWNSFSNLVVKYGLVPIEVMPESNSSSNTSWMLRLVKRKLREDGMELRELAASKKKDKEIRARKIEILKEVYRMLAINLGVPPTEFQWRYKDKEGNLSELKTYTPQAFAKELLPEIMYNDYVMFMNDPTRPYYKLYEIDNYRNVEEGRNWLYINLPNEDLKKMALESIKNNEAMYASCDVGKQLNNEEGLSSMDNYDFESIYNLSFDMDKKQRILTRESGSSHGMALVAVDVDQNEKPIKWQFENSWGSNSGHNGYLTFTDEWFDNYIFRLVVLKKFIDPEILKILDQKPILLPPWDPMS